MAKIVNFVDYLVLGSDESDIIEVRNGDITSTDVFGGLGNDVYFIDAFKLNSAGDVVTNQDHVIEAVGGGVDTVNVELFLETDLIGVFGSQGYTLDENVENLNVTAYTDNLSYTFTLNGNTSANVITASNYAFAGPVFYGNAQFLVDGGAGNDKLITGKNNDELNGGTGNDTLIGGAGNDTYQVDSALDVITENLNGGYDTVITSATTYTLSANIEQLAMTGVGNINATGNALDNNFTGNAGNNSLSGLDGNDSLSGANGNDTLMGGNGNDNLAGGNGNDNLQGGAGADVLDGGDGADVIDGGAGDDTYFIDASDIVKDTGVGGNDTIYTSEQLAGDLASGIENLLLDIGILNGRGNALNNFITGSADNNQLFGLAGNDGLDGGFGDDLLDGGDGNDTLNGGAGNDLMLGGNGNDVYFVNTAGDAAVEVSASGGIDLVVSSTFSLTMGDFIENMTLAGNAYAAQGNTLNNVMIGTDSSNDIHGDAGNDKIDGKGGNDSLFGDLGNDTLDGGTGTDALEGGAGADLYIVDDLGDQVFEFGGATEIDTVQSGVTFSINNYSVQLVENLTLVGLANINGIGNAQNNIIKGNDGNNQLLGNGGNDTLIGGLGNDTLDGGIGNDSMTGGVGYDRYYVDSTSDKVIELANQGIDAIYTSESISLANFANVEYLVYTGVGTLNSVGNVLDNNIEGNLGNDTIDGAAGNDYLFGNGGGDVLKGGAGNDFLIGGAGDDILIGGAGNDVYYMQDALDDVITEAANAGNDSVVAYASVSLLTLLNIENATLDNGAGIADITGSAANNYLTGNDYSNQIIGGLGSDTIDGGDGFDLLDGGAGNDTYYSFGAIDDITDSAGIDTLITDVNSVNLSVIGLQQIENITLVGNANINATGNDANNLMKGNDYNNALFGNFGNDTLIGGAGSDLLNGGTGNDSMVGGLGNDFYEIGEAGDKVVELANQGIDTIRSDINFSLNTANGLNVENLILGEGGATLAKTATGNALNNAITGNSNNNILDGGAGNDTLNGSFGLDTLTGGAGADTFVFDSANFNSGFDTVKDFTFGVDKIGLIGFGGLFTGAAGSLNVDNFALNGASDGDDYFIYNKGTGDLYYDSDGNGGGAGQIQIAHFNPGTTLSSVSFFDAS